MTQPTHIFFLSDFGLSDAYVGIVKAVIAGLAPGARVVDLAHELPAQDLRCGAYQLFEAAPYLPPGSIVLGVVDPGVGSDRRAVVVEGAHHRWVVPDNGLMTLAFEHDPPQRAFVLEEPAYRLAETSATFHGRDVFGPAAAHLAAGVPPESFGRGLDPGQLVRLPVGLSDGDEGEILTFDRFGNAITTLRGRRARGPVRLGEQAFPLAHHYAEVNVGQALALVGSAGLVEVSVRNGSARRELGLREGQRVSSG
jgi:hypothetical protein